MVEPWLSSHLPCDACEWFQYFQPLARGAIATYTNIISLQLRPGNNIDAQDVVGVDLKYEIFQLEISDVLSDEQGL